MTPTLVATVEHVVDGAVSISLVRNGSLLGHGTVIGADPARDLALVRSSNRISGFDFQFAQSLPQLGEDVLALGFPLGLPLTVTKGSVSGLGRTIPIDGVNRRALVQTDAAVNHGNSGGPLLATDTGQVVGLVDLGTTEANGIAFAVSAATASPLLTAWKKAPQPAALAFCGGLAPVSVPSAPAGSRPGAEMTQYILSVGRVLETSAAVRKLLVAAVSEAHTDPLTAKRTVGRVVAARRDELASAVSAAVPPGAITAQAAFVRAFQVSLTSDLLYRRWLNNDSATILGRAQANDAIAVATKARFLALYNRLRSSFGFPTIPSDFPF